MTKKKILDNIPTSSPAMELNKVDIKKIGKGALIAGSAAALLSLAEWLATGNLELWKSALYVALSVGINTGIKYFQGQPKN